MDDKPSVSITVNVSEPVGNIDERIRTSVRQAIAQYDAHLTKTLPSRLRRLAQHGI